MVIEYTVINRGLNLKTGCYEYIPVVNAMGVEIFRGSVYDTAIDAWYAAYESKQSLQVRNGADPFQVGR